MQTRLQTKVTNKNQAEFYQSLYNTDRSLLDLTAISADQYLLVDCRGNEYRQKYPDLNIVILETLSTAKQFKLERKHFDFLIDNQIYNDPTWPKINTNNCAVIFDWSPVFKYLTVSEIVMSLEKLADCYNPITILLQSSLFFIDDNRLGDRLHNLVDMQIKNYVVEKFYYDTVSTTLTIQFKIKKIYDDYTN